MLERQGELATGELLRQRTGAGWHDPSDLVRNIFAGLRDWARAPGWRGSGFTRAAMELAWAPGHPARRAAATHKRTREMMFAEALNAAGAPAPNRSARQLCVIIEGAMALFLIHGDPAYLDEAENAALELFVNARPPAAQ